MQALGAGCGAVIAAPGAKAAAQPLAAAGAPVAASDGVVKASDLTGIEGLAAVASDWTGALRQRWPSAKAR